MDWVTDYLALLGLAEQPPTLAYLRQLTRAQLTSVPFENITSILRRAAAGDSPVPALDRELELQAWRDRRGGGLCFEVTDLFGALLSSLGFAVQPVLATISFPGSHGALLVEIDGEPFLVDAGNGAPFFEPIALAGDSVELRHVGLTYRFRPVAERPDHWIQDRQLDGEWRPFCTYDLSLPSASDQEAAYQRHHVRGQSWVVDNLSLIRCSEVDVWSLRDNRLSHFTADGKTVVTLPDNDAVRQVIASKFGLPAAPVTEALAALS